MEPKGKPVLEIQTLLGWTWDQVERVLAAPLPPQCYKPISGGSGEKAGLTDIKPQALITVLTKLFGPCGIGWGVDYDPDRVIMDVDAGATYSANIEVWYVVIEGGEKMVVRLQTPSYNKNPSMTWSCKGMITTAIGSACYRLGWQGLVQMGSLSHKNAEKIYSQAGPHPFERDILTALAASEDGDETESPESVSPTTSIDSIKTRWLAEAKAVGLTDRVKLIEHLGSLYTALNGASVEELAVIGSQGVARIKEYEA